MHPMYTHGDMSDDVDDGKAREDDDDEDEEEEEDEDEDGEGDRIHKATRQP